MLHIHTDINQNTVELGDTIQVDEINDATVVAVDKIREVCTLEFINAAGNEERVETPMFWIN